MVYLFGWFLVGLQGILFILGYVTWGISERVVRLSGILLIIQFLIMVFAEYLLKYIRQKKKIGGRESESFHKEVYEK